MAALDDDPISRLLFMLAWLFWMLYAASAIYEAGHRQGRAERDPPRNSPVDTPRTEPHH